LALCHAERAFPEPAAIDFAATVRGRELKKDLSQLRIIRAEVSVGRIAETSYLTGRSGD
jgi:hypothetical protein